ncbi:MAG: extracellular solute-binding protein [Bacilli bacterium]|nr:extracellular solute-binding protein [Bacilli bacterium]
MEATTNKARTKFRDTKFAKFIASHKKLTIGAGVVLALAIAITVPAILGSLPYQGDFSYALNAYKSAAEPSTEIAYEASFADASGAVDVDGRKAILSSPGDVTSYQVDVAEAGDYSFTLSEDILSGGFRDNEFVIRVDGDVACSRGKVRAYVHNVTEEFNKDRYGNEICPSQEALPGWHSQGIYDYDYLDPSPHRFTLSAGSHSIELEHLSGENVALGGISLQRFQAIPSYEKYREGRESATYGQRIKEIQGEHFAYKNDTSPIPSSSADIHVLPYATMESMLNVLGNFSSSEQIVTYSFEVEEPGDYRIRFNLNIPSSNHVAFATFRIDGATPFGELLHYPLSPTSGFSEVTLQNASGEPFRFYLDKGVHELSIKVDHSLYRGIISDIDAASNSLSELYLALKRIAGTSSGNKEWDPETDFPGITERISAVRDTVASLLPKIREINGSDANFQALISLQSAVTSLNGILEKPRQIPNRYAEFSEGSGSIVENLATASSDIKSTSIEIDRILIGVAGDDRFSEPKNGFDAFWEKTKKFFLSFTYDYSMTTSSENTIEIWVARSRQYVDLMQEMIDNSTFTKDTGYNVRFILLSDESKLILSNAARISPDGVMGISNWLPYEMGIRDLTVDLTTFPDYGEVIDRFSPGALISLIADGKGLALPETQDFYVLYYRKDILKEYGLEVPSTWQELIGTLPKMQRNGLNFYLPLGSSTSSKSIMTTAPFIYQYGGNLFTDDGLKTTIDEETSLNGIKMMTELFTLYGLPTQVANFFNSFRAGSLPMGISTFDTYVKLTLSAPELAGKWGMALAPGVMRDGKIVRDQTGSAQSMCLIDKGEKKNNAGWELLKWWSSKETQAEFGRRLSLQYGKGYIWNSANLEAFDQSIIFNDDEKATILGQWQHMREIPRVPGWYMLERELSNSWNNIVLNGKNTRSTIEDAVDLINKELTRKLIEFGYLDSAGNVLRAYQVTTRESIEKLKERRAS